MSHSALASSPDLGTRLRRGTGRALRASWLHPLNDTVAINDLLGSLNPRWSLTEIRAEVIERVQETADTLSLRLRPNRLWSGFQAGQHVLITVEIRGVRHQRAYSLSSDPADRRLLRITVKRQPGGRVSNWLHDQLRTGDVLTLSAPTGDFKLAATTEPLLLLSAGSGITPMRALLHEIQARGPQPGSDIVLVHLCRDTSDRIFGAELEQLQRAMPTLRVLNLHTAQGRPTLAAILEQVPDYAQRKTYLCGPASFMADVETHWQQQGIAAQLRLERFGVPMPRRDGANTQSMVNCSSSDMQFSSNSGEALLPAAERAGLKPAYGCRIGICRTCLCHKRSGVVENLLDGKTSAGDEWIRLCVSAPRSDLELDL